MGVREKGRHDRTKVTDKCPRCGHQQSLSTKNRILAGNMIEIEMGKGKTFYWHLINFEGKYELMSEK